MSAPRASSPKNTARSRFSFLGRFAKGKTAAPDAPPPYSLKELCYGCFSFRERHGEQAKHRPCFKPGCHCWCSRVKGYVA